jgi:peptide/nickel transport system substrate-binding protein
VEASDRNGWHRLIALLTVLLLVAAACGGGDDDGETTAPTGGSETTAADDDASDIDPDGVVTLGYDLVASAKGGVTFDPAEVTTQLTDSGLFYYVYGALLRPTTEGELVPDLAESTEVVDDNTIEITLRDGLTFSDGTPFDAEVVKAGLERSQAATDSAGFGSSFFDLEGVEVASPTSLTLTIPNGTAASWHDTYLGSWETTIVHPDSDFSTPIGAGPMKVVDFRPEQRMVLEKNPGYWDADSIQVGGIELVHVEAQSEGAASSLAAGQVDFSLINSTQIPAIGNNEHLAVPNPNTLMTLMVCKREGPLADADVRKALNRAIDRDSINEAVFDGTYTPAHGLWPEGHRFHDPSVEDAVSYDPEAARELLAEAGYEAGFEFDLYVIQSGGMPEVTEIMQQQFAEIGVRANLIPSANYVADFLGAQKPGAGAVPTMSPNRLKLLQWSGESIGNTCGYQDPELESLEDELNAVSDTSDEAVDLWHQIEQKAVADDALSVFILFGSTIVGYDDDHIGNLKLMSYTIAVPDIRETHVKAS